jgi:hypothetical protein
MKDEEKAEPQIDADDFGFDYGSFKRPLISVL